MPPPAPPPHPLTRRAACDTSASESVVSELMALFRRSSSATSPGSVMQRLRAGMAAASRMRTAGTGSYARVRQASSRCNCARKGGGGVHA